MKKRNFRLIKLFILVDCNLSNYNNKKSKYLIDHQLHKYLKYLNYLKNLKFLKFLKLYLYKYEKLTQEFENYQILMKKVIQIF
jgi:hypothetical protein